ncbi:hypothetical protein Avbf_00051, partial [Armadillidium vulgare]
KPKKKEETIVKEEYIKPEEKVKETVFEEVIEERPAEEKPKKERKPRWGKPEKVETKVEEIITEEVTVEEDKPTKELPIDEEKPVPEKKKPKEKKETIVDTIVKEEYIKPEKEITETIIEETIEEKPDEEKKPRKVVGPKWLRFSETEEVITEDRKEEKPELKPKTQPRWLKFTEETEEIEEVEEQKPERKPHSQIKWLRFKDEEEIIEDTDRETITERKPKLKKKKEKKTKKEETTVEETYETVVEPDIEEVKGLPDDVVEEVKEMPKRKPEVAETVIEEGPIFSKPKVEETIVKKTVIEEKTPTKKITKTVVEEVSEQDLEVNERKPKKQIYFEEETEDLPAEELPYDVPKKIEHRVHMETVRIEKPEVRIGKGLHEPVEFEDVVTEGIIIEKQVATEVVEEKKPLEKADVESITILKDTVEKIQKPEDKKKVTIIEKPKYFTETIEETKDIITRTPKITEHIVTEETQQFVPDKTFEETIIEEIQETQLLNSRALLPEPEKPKEKVLQIKMTRPKKETIPTDTVEKFDIELCVPGFKALIHLATDSSIDLETLELEPLEKIEFQEDIAKLNIQIKKGVQVRELMTMVKEDEFPSLKAPEAQPRVLDVVDKFARATVTEVLVKEAEEQPQKNIGVKSVIKAVETGKEKMEEIIMEISKEFGPSSQPVREIASMGQLLSEGVKCDEVVALVEAGHFPALQREEAQKPLVSIITSKGHAGTVCEVLLEESVEEFDKFKPKGESAKLSEVKTKLDQATMQVINVKTFKAEMAPGAKAYVKAAQEEHIEEKILTSKVHRGVKEEMMRVVQLIRHGVIEEDVIQMIEAGEFPHLIREENQANLLDVVEEFGFRAIVEDVIVQQAVQHEEQRVGVRAFIRMAQQENYNIEQFLQDSMVKEFGPEQFKPIEELTRVNIMLKEGIQAQEIITLAEAGELPELSKPEAQAPLVRAIQNVGHTPIVCQVIIEESTKEITRDLPKVDVASITSEKTILEKAVLSEVKVEDCCYNL